MKPKKRIWLCLAVSGILSLLQGCASVSSSKPPENLMQSSKITQTEAPQLSRLSEELATELLGVQYLQLFANEHDRIATILLGALEGEANAFADAESFQNVLITALVKSKKVHLVVNKAGFLPPALPLQEEEILKLAADSNADFFLQSLVLEGESAPVLQFNLIDLKTLQCVWSGQRSVLIIKT